MTAIDPKALTAELEAAVFEIGEREEAERAEKEAREPFDRFEEEDLAEAQAMFDALKASGACDKDLEDKVFGFSPIMEHMRVAAHEAGVSSWAVMDEEVHRAALRTPASVKLPPLIGHTPAPCNLISVVAAASGGGKGAAAGTRALVSACPGDALRENTTHVGRQVGSGEAISKLYVEWQPKKQTEDDEDDSSTRRPGGIASPAREYRQVIAENGSQVLVLVRDTANIVFPEVDKLVAILSRTAGETMTAELRALWSGETLGSVTKTNTMFVPAGVYRGVVTIMGQLDRCAGLFANESGGMLQRVAWICGTNIQTTKTLLPELRRPPMTVTYPTWAPGMQLTVEPSICEFVQREHDDVRSGRIMRAPLDAHKRLIQLKYAAMVTSIHGRTHTDWPEWEWAENVLVHSTRMRSAVRGAIKTAAKKQRRLAGIEEAWKRNAIEAETAATTAAKTAAAAVVADRLRRRPDGVQRRNLQGFLKNHPSHNVGEGLNTLLTWMQMQGWVQLDGADVTPGARLDAAPTGARS